MSKISRDVIFSEKKAPAGMPTHRTGVENTKNQRQKSPRNKIQRQKSPRIWSIGVLGGIGVYGGNIGVWGKKIID